MDRLRHRKCAQMFLRRILERDGVWERHRTTLGGTQHRKKYTERGDTAHTFFDWVNNWDGGEIAHSLLI